MSYTGVEIFPPIGISHAGDSSEHYLASENPDQEHPTDFTFRGTDGKIKRSAVTFHAYLYGEDGKPSIEATSPDYTLNWTVNVANKKGAWVRFKGKQHQETFRLRNARVDPYPDDLKPPRDYNHTETRSNLIIEDTKPISGTNMPMTDLTGSFKGSADAAVQVNLGKIGTDAKGRLVFLAGTGESKCVKEGTDHPDLMEKFDNDDWYDTLCDGNVTVRVTAIGIDFTSTLKTIVIGAPPKFSSGLYCPTSLYDLIEDVFERPRRIDRDYNCGEVFYESDIKPIIDGVSLLSWTNQKADEGHGPHNAESFPHDRLSNNAVAHAPLRKSIFSRVRAPVKPDDPANIFTRNEQAYEYYMPRLGGNSGDNPEDMGNQNHRDRWASLTELQYDRLAKWAQGNFNSGRRPTSGTTVEQATASLTLAGLKWTTGAPLFPGIEMYWAAEFSSMYNLYPKPLNAHKPDTRFRFHNNVLPGDLTKGLSLPWQADFYMCNTHWWPHTRPDDIVTNGTWKMAKHLDPITPVPVDRVVRRALWDEGLQRDVDDETVGSTEMVKKWQELGFISNVQSKPMIFVETERTLLRNGLYTILNVTQNKFIGGTNDNDSTRPVGVVSLNHMWRITYLDDKFYRLTVADFASTTDTANNVIGYKNVMGDQFTWIIEAIAGHNGYTIKTRKTSQYWTLTGGAIDTNVTVANAATNFQNQTWKIIPYRPLYTISNITHNKFVGCTTGDGLTTPIGITLASQNWDIHHIKGNLHSLIVADYTAAADTENKVNGHKNASAETLKTWVVQRTANDNGYTIATNETTPKFWTLASVNTNTQVTVATRTTNHVNQLWEVNAYKPLYTISHVAHTKFVGTTGTTTVKPIGVVSSSQNWYLEHLDGNLYCLIVAGYTAVADATNNVNGHTDASAQTLKTWVVRGTANDNEFTIATNESTPKFWTLANGSADTQVTVATRAANHLNQLWKVIPYRPLYTIFNVAHTKFVGLTGTETVRPIGVVASSQNWYIERLDGNLYRLVVADYTAAANATNQVNGYKDASAQSLRTWVVKGTANDNEYTIATNETTPKFWTLASGSADTQVTIAAGVTNYVNQIWKFSLV